MNKNPIDSSVIAKRLATALDRTQKDIESYFDRVKQGATDIIRENVADAIRSKTLTEDIAKHVDKNVSFVVAKHFRQKDFKGDLDRKIESIVGEEFSAFINKSVKEVFEDYFRENIRVMIQDSIEKQTDYVIETTKKIALTTFTDAISTRVKEQFNDVACKHVITKKIDELMGALGKSHVKRLLETELEHREGESDKH